MRNAIVLSIFLGPALGCAHTRSSDTALESGSRAAEAQPDGWKQEFGEDDRDLASSGRNTYFILEPGYTLELEGREKGSKTGLVIRVLEETKEIGGVVTRVVEERETRGDEITEISRNFFAFSRRTNNVYYFGEEVDMYAGGRVSGHEGSWMHGADGARYGMAMPGAPKIGLRYYQELAPEIAMDRAEIVNASETLDTPAGQFESCLKVEETTPLEPGSKEYKHYAPGIGLIRDGDFRLVRYGQR